MAHVYLQPGLPTVNLSYLLQSLAIAVAMLMAATAFLALVRRSEARFFRAPLPAALAVMATWAMFLLAPGTAEASTFAGATAHGGLLTLLGLGLAFGVAVGTQAVATAPGAATSEFQLARYVTYFGMALSTIGTVLATIESILPSGSKLAVYVGIGLTVVGALTKVAMALGYSSDRTDLKVAQAQASGAQAAATTTAQASANAGAAAESLK